MVWSLGGTTSHNSLFANDSIVFLEAEKNSLLELTHILRVYEEASGQTVNLQKSSIFFGKGCEDEANCEYKF